MAFVVYIYWYLWRIALSLKLYPAPRGQSVVVVVFYLLHFGDEVGAFDQLLRSAASRHYELRLRGACLKQRERLREGEAAVSHRRHYLVEDQ